MGLRETKAVRTRTRVIDVALDLFTAQGYDATTMEQIAERAEIGATTLYRYFPSKDLLVLDRLLTEIDFAAHLRAQPDDLPLPEALGGALTALADALDDPVLRLPELRRVIDATSAPRAKLWDAYADLSAALETEIARRSGAPTSDISIRMTTATMLAVFQLVDEDRKRSDYGRSTREITEAVLGALPGASITVPATPSSAAASSPASSSSAVPSPVALRADAGR